MCYYYGYGSLCEFGASNTYGNCCMSEGWRIFLWILFALSWILCIILWIKRYQRRAARRRDMMAAQSQQQPEVIVVNNGQPGAYGQQAYGQQAYGQQAYGQPGGYTPAEQQYQQPGAYTN